MFCLKPAMPLLTVAFSVCYVLAADKKVAPKDFDHKFLSKVPSHHQGAIEMAKLCQQKAQRADLKTFCSKLAPAQGEEKAQMDGWRASWYGGQEAAVPEMGAMVAKHKQTMAKLQKAMGNHFDQMFLMSMTEHHQDGMPDMRSCTASAKHGELKQLCQQMMTEQQSEMAQMSAWMKETMAH